MDQNGYSQQSVASLREIANFLMQNSTVHPMRSVSLLLLVAGSLLMAGEAGAQALGEPAPNKVFLSSWNMPAGVDELTDFSAQGKVVLLDWFGVY